MTPILPYPEDALSDGTAVVTTDEISSDEAVRDIFDTAYNSCNNNITNGIKIQTSFIMKPKMLCFFSYETKHIMYDHKI